MKKKVRAKTHFNTEYVGGQNVSLTKPLMNSKIIEIGGGPP